MNMKRLSTRFVAVLFVSMSTLSAMAQYADESWTEVWRDDFNGTELNADNWNIEQNSSGGGNNELQYYGPEGVSVSGGNLILTASRTPNGGRQITSGRINSRGKIFFTHGKLEASILLPNTANGLWPAFWMLGENIGTHPWPQCGEVDVLEMGNQNGFNGRQDKYFNGACHWGYYVNGGYPNYAHATDEYGSLQDGNYHTFTLVWTEEKVSMYVDRSKGGIHATPYYEMGINGITTDQDPGYYFHKNFHILFNLAVGGMFPGIYDPNGITAPMPAQMKVDWVRICQPAEDDAYTFKVADEDGDTDEIGSDPDTDPGQFGTRALDDNNQFSFDPTKGTDYVLISTSTGVTEMLRDRTLKNYNVDETTNFLWIWSDTYVYNASTGVNSFGFQEGYSSFKVGTVGWSGMGFASAGGSGGKDLSMIDDSYILHFAMKGNDLLEHRSHTITIGNVSFVIGKPDGNSVVLGDYPRDNRWYYFDIPVKWLKTLTTGDLFTNAAQYEGNVVAFGSGGVAGTPLKFDNIFFYKSTTPIPDIPTTDAYTQLGNYGSEALRGGTSTFDFENGKNYVPIMVSDQVKARMAGNIRADYNLDGTNQALYIWDGANATYSEVNTAGQQNSFGYNEGYYSYVVLEKGWSGMGVKFETARDLSMLDDTYWLHFAMKGNDYLKHVGQTVTIGNVKFMIGNASGGIPSLGDYKRDGQWYAFDIPVKALKLMADPLFDNETAFNGNILTLSSGTKQGNELQFDNVFFYQNDTMNPNAGADTDTKLGKYVTAAMSGGSSTFNIADGDNYVLIDVGAGEKALMNGKIRADYTGKPALNIWMTNYENPPQPTFAEAAATTAVNSFGLAEAYHSFRLLGKGWGNVAYQFTGDKVDLSMLDEVDADGHEYYLHFAMRAEDYLTHVDYTLTIGGDAKISIGKNGAAGILTDFRRNGEWYNFDIPVSKLKEVATSGNLLNNGGGAAEYGGDFIVFDAGARQGNELQFDNVFFYRNLNPKESGEDPNPEDPVVDETAPVVPTVTLNNASVTETSARMSLTATDDSNGTITYTIYINNVEAGTVSGKSGTTVQYDLAELTAGTTYAITATATDASGNTSAKSEAVNVTTLSSDVTAPATPQLVGSVSATASTAAIIVTTTDNSGGTITYNAVIRNKATNEQVATPTASATSGQNATLNVSALSALTTYTYAITATDASGNTSGTLTGEFTTAEAIQGGETEFGLKYTYEITQNGTDVTINFVCTNPNEFVGLVGAWLWDETNGFKEVGVMPQTLTGYDYGTTLKFRAKWIDQVNGNNISDYVYYTIKEQGTLVDEGADANGVHKLSGTWDNDAFKEIDAQVKATAYDVTALNLATWNITRGDLQNPNALFVGTAAQMATMAEVNAIYKDGTNYVANTGGLVFLDSNGSKTKDYSLNTSVKPLVGKVSYQNRNVSARTWATQILPFTTMLVGNKPEAYTLNAQTENDGTLTLTFQRVAETAEGLTLQADVPYLLWFDTPPSSYEPVNIGDVATMNFVPAPSGTEGFSLTGTYQTIHTTADAKIYVIPGGETNKETFQIRLSSNGRVLPFRTYFTPQGAVPSKINIFIDEEPAVVPTQPTDDEPSIGPGQPDGEPVADGIRGLSDEQLESLLPVYSIDGRKVSTDNSRQALIQLPDGIYIINGKKVVIRNQQ